MKKIALISLGCEKNLVDSENILGLLVKNKYEIVNNKEEADILIINTCGFIESSKKESIDTTDCGDFGIDRGHRLSSG